MLAGPLCRTFSPAHIQCFSHTLLLIGCKCDRKLKNIQAQNNTAMKIWRNVSGFVVSPASLAGVLISRPNFNASCGRMKLQYD